MPVLLKIESATNSAVFVETLVDSTVAGAWETLTFDFANPMPNLLGLDDAMTYDKISIIPDFSCGGASAAVGDETFYVDDIRYAP